VSACTKEDTTDKKPFDDAHELGVCVSVSVCGCVWVCVGVCGFVWVCIFVVKNVYHCWESHLTMRANSMCV